MTWRTYSNDLTWKDLMCTNVSFTERWSIHVCPLISPLAIKIMESVNSYLLFRKITFDLQDERSSEGTSSHVIVDSIAFFFSFFTTFLFQWLFWSVVWFDYHEGSILYSIRLFTRYLNTFVVAGVSLENWEFAVTWNHGSLSTQVKHFWTWQFGLELTNRAYINFTVERMLPVSGE